MGPRPPGTPRHPTKRPIRLVTAQMNRLLDRYRAGATYRDLADEFQINRCTAIEHVRRAGLRPRWRILRSEEIIRASKPTTTVALSTGSARTSVSAATLLAWPSAATAYPSGLAEDGSTGNRALFAAAVIARWLRTPMRSVCRRSSTIPRNRHEDPVGSPAVRECPPSIRCKTGSASDIIGTRPTWGIRVV